MRTIPVGAMNQKAALRIMPVEEITAERPDCFLCTWAPAGSGVFQLRYVSAACRVHQDLERC
jgi:hypothetical protein